jgi:aminobenzoyl-glutamate utilization protein A
MTHSVDAAITEIEAQLIKDRRDFHHYAEAGWQEFRTASLVAKRLCDLGYQVSAGRQVIRDEDRMGLPPTETLEASWHRAVEQGGDRAYLDALRGGFTGVVGLLKNGDGPTVGIRFDMDALAMSESKAKEHRPAAEGFASVNEDAAHTCGHDAHTAIGLGLAQVLVELKDSIQGRLKLIFQPAEEGVRGARSMVNAGVLDDVDFLLGLHLFSGWAPGEFIPGMGGFAATEKFDAVFTGAPAHAGGNPQDGRNALLAAATAVLNLYAIPRHGDGATRVNVGKLRAGVSRNVIPPGAILVAETRGATSELSQYMHGRAVRVLEAAAEMYGCSLEIRAMGSAPSAESDVELAGRVACVAGQLGGFKLLPPVKSGGSEDLAYMMQRVQERGGQATSIGLGADLYGISYEAEEGREAVLGAHTPEFDVDESVLKVAVRLLAMVVLDIVVRTI